MWHWKKSASVEKNFDHLEENNFPDDVDLQEEFVIEGICIGPFTFLPQIPIGIVGENWDSRRKRISFVMRRRKASDNDNVSVHWREELWY